MLRIGRAAAHALLTIAMIVVLAAPALAQAQSEKDVEALNSRIVQLYKQGRYAEAAPAAEGTVTAAEFALGADHPVTLASVSNLADLYYAQRRYAEAEPLYTRALAGFERVLGPDHPDTLRIARTLAAMYADQRRYDEAANFHKRTVEAEERLLGKEHPDTLKSLMKLGYLTWKNGRYNEAGDIYGRVLEPAERVFGKESPEFIGLLNDLALLRLSQGDWGGAAALLRRGAAAASRTPPGPEGGGQPPAGKNKNAAGQSSALRMLVKAVYRLAPGGYMPDAASSRETFEIAQRALGFEAVASLAQGAAQDASGDSDCVATAGPAPLSVEEVQSLLAPDEALVLFLDTQALESTPQETFIWVVTKTDLRWVRSGWGTSALTREVDALRCGASDEPRCKEPAGKAYTPVDEGAGQPPPSYQTHAHKLYLSLFGQVEDLIRGKRLLLVPSGPLAQLPFQVLVTDAAAGGEDKHGASLVRVHALTVLPAVSALRARRQG